MANVLRWCTLLFLSFATYADTLLKSDQTYNVAILKNDIIAEHHFALLERELGYKFNYLFYRDFPQVMNALITGEADLAANVTYSKERARLFNISTPTNLLYLYFISKDKYFSDIKTIGIIDQVHFLKALEKRFPNIKVVSFSSFGEGMELMRHNKVDGIIESIVKLDELLNMGYQAELINDIVPIEPVGLASSFNISSQQLEHMASILQSDRAQSQWVDTLTKYQYNVRKKAIRRQVEKLGIDTNEPVKIKLEKIPILSEYQSDGKAIGMIPDILNEACDILGLNCLIISKGDEVWANMINDLEAEKFDILAPLTINDNWKNTFYFSKPFYISRSAIIKRNNYKPNVHENLSSLIVERIGAVYDDYYYNLLPEFLPNKKIIGFDNLEALVNGLVNEEVDYILMDYIAYNSVINKYQQSLPIKVDEYFKQSVQVENSFAFAKNERGRELSILFNRALSIMDTNRIIAKYNKTPNWSLILQGQKDNEINTYLFFSALVTMLVVFVFIQYYKSVTDELTKLKNRRALYSKYGKGISDGIVVYLDLNSFKILNDNYGHQVGDEVLIKFAKRIKAHWQGKSYRIGGDEFILIDNLTLEQCKEALEKITCFNFTFSDKKMQIHSSIGICEVKAPITLEDALLVADAEMYNNKKSFYTADKMERERRSV